MLEISLAPSMQSSGEDNLLGGEALGCFQSAWRALRQQPQIGEAHIDQPRAEPVLPRAQHRGQRQQRLASGV